MKIFYLILVLIIVLVFIIGFLVFYKFQQQSDLNKKISDEELLQYAQSTFNKQKMIFKNIIIGKHKGVSVRVTFPCSDLCPDNTIRIIRYDVELSQCHLVGGEIKSIYVPRSISMGKEQFCFPKVIVENNIYKFVGK